MMQAASPSSSTTTPSPSLPFLHPPSHNAGSVMLPLGDLDPQEREERQHAVKKFLARAECSKLTRGLRARLAYASYKATNNLSHVPLPVLEHRIHPPSPSPAPSPSPVPAPTSPYPVAQKRRADAMPPPASPSRSLYSSLLGPPPSKRPRHVYGPAPTPGDLLPSYSPTTPSRRKPSQSPRRTPASPFVNGGQGRTVRTVLQGRARSNVTEKEDMNAAATLTALMFNRASPRQQRKDEGVSRTSSGTASLAPPRTTTPAPGGKGTEDADAAELMLYLATSPSPVRPSAPKRTPGSVGMGRVLFANAAARAGEKDTASDRETTPGLTASQSSLPSSQDTTMLLPPPPSPSFAPQSQPQSQPRRTPPGDPLGPKKAVPFDVSRRLFVDNDDAHRMAELRDGNGGAGRFGAVQSLGKGIDLVEAK